MPKQAASGRYTTPSSDHGRFGPVGKGGASVTRMSMARKGALASRLRWWRRVVAARVAVHAFCQDVPSGKEGDAGQDTQLGHQDEPIGQEESEGARQECDHVRGTTSAPMLSQG